MKPLLLDTNVLIRFFRSDRKIATTISRYEKILVPTVVIGEFRAGVDQRTADGRRQMEVLESFLDSPSVEIATITEDVASTYAQIFKVLKEKGTPIPQNDLWIAACAVECGAMIYSLDRHFANIPLVGCLTD